MVWFPFLFICIIRHSTQLIYSICHLYSDFFWDVVYLTLIGLIELLMSLCRPSYLCLANDGIKRVHYYTLFIFWILKEFIKKFLSWFLCGLQIDLSIFSVSSGVGVTHVKLMRFFISLCLCLYLPHSLVLSFLCFCLIYFKLMFGKWYCRWNYSFPVMEFFEVFAFLWLCILENSEDVASESWSSYL